MALEDTLNEINTSLKTIVTILQSAGAISASEAPVGGAADPAATTAETRKPGRPKKTDTTTANTGLGLVAGDPEGTRYWISESLSTVYAQKPGDPDPADQTFKIESAAAYMTKKDEFAKKAPATGTQSTGAAANPAANTPAASTASSTTAAPTWKNVLDELMVLNKGTESHQGKTGVLAVLKHFGLEGQKVPALEALGKHAEILEAVKKVMANQPLAAVDDDLGI